MRTRRNLLSLLVLPLVGLGLLVGEGTGAASAGAGSSAAAVSSDVYNFRMSNFGAFVANICVVTDTETVCTGAWATSKSEIFQVRANSRDGWYCVANIVYGEVAYSDRFSRNEYKECAIQGTTQNAFWVLKRP